MTTKEVGLYVHIPFCKKKCNYCDFCSLPQGDREVPAAYVDRLCEEIDSYKGENITLSTIFFGGGTPTLLSVDDMKKIFSSIHSSFAVSLSAEVTFEANPGTVTRDKMIAYKTLGFNRVSIGMQSAHENELKKLGRIHNFSEFLESYRLIRSVGFDNVNVDVMYGIPHQTKESFAQTLESVTSLNPEHISCYGLIVEEGTPFYKERESLPIPSLDDECDMYDFACAFLSSKGYSHYEISNYAKPNFESKHNLCYWRTKDYIGVGASAHSCYMGKRFSNTSDVLEYIHSSTVNNMSSAPLITDEDARYEFAMLALRLKEGFSLNEYQAKFGASFTDGKEDVLKNLIGAGLLNISDGRISLTEKGFYLSNSILIEIL